MINNKSKIFFLISLTLFSLATLVLTVVNNNPYISDNVVFATFYISFLASLFGTMSLVIFFVKSRLSQNSVLLHSYQDILRLSLLLSIIITLLLLLRSLRVLDIWVSLPLMIAVILLEMYFRASKRKKYE